MRVGWSGAGLDGIADAGVERIAGLGVVGEDEGGLAVRDDPAEVGGLALGGAEVTLGPSVVEKQR